MDEIEITDFCECLSYQKITANPLVNLNRHIIVFTEIEREQLDFILEFIDNAEKNLYLRYSLNNQIHILNNVKKLNSDSNF